MTTPGSKFVDVSIRLPVESWFDDDAQCFVSYCPVLKLHSAGKTQGGAMRALESAIRMFIQLYQHR